MSLMERFEKLQKTKKWKMAALCFHALAGVHLLSIFNKMDSHPLDGVFVVIYALVLAAYWKMIARIKRAEFDKK